MSRKYQPKTKEYAQVRIISSDEAYVGKGKLNSEHEFIGKIDRDLPSKKIAILKRMVRKTGD